MYILSLHINNTVTCKSNISDITLTCWGFPIPVPSTDTRHSDRPLVHVLRKHVTWITPKHTVHPSISWPLGACLLAMGNGQGPSLTFWSCSVRWMNDWNTFAQKIQINVHQIYNNHIFSCICKKYVCKSQVVQLNLALKKMTCLQLWPELNIVQYFPRSLWQWSVLSSLYLCLLLSVVVPLCLRTSLTPVLHCLQNPEGQGSQWQPHLGWWQCWTAYRIARGESHL